MYSSANRAKKFSSDNNMLAEAVLINGFPSFPIAKNNGSIEIERSIELADKILIPLDSDSYINKAYSFLSEEQVRYAIENVKHENLDSLYKRIKSIWGKMLMQMIFIYLYAPQIRFILVFRTK